MDNIKVMHISDALKLGYISISRPWVKNQFDQVPYSWVEKEARRLQNDGIEVVIGSSCLGFEVCRKPLTEEEQYN